MWRPATARAGTVWWGWFNRGAPSGRRNGVTQGCSLGWGEKETPLRGSVIAAGPTICGMGRYFVHT